MQVITAARWGERAVRGLGSAVSTTSSATTAAVVTSACTVAGAAAAVPGVTTAVSTLRGLTASASQQRLAAESAAAAAASSSAAEGLLGTLVVAASFREMTVEHEHEEEETEEEASALHGRTRDRTAEYATARAARRAERGELREQGEEVEASCSTARRVFGEGCSLTSSPPFRFRAAHPHEALLVELGLGAVGFEGCDVVKRTVAAAALLAHGTARAEELRRQVRSPPRWLHRCLRVLRQHDEWSSGPCFSDRKGLLSDVRVVGRDMQLEACGESDREQWAQHGEGRESAEGREERATLGATAAVLEYELSALMHALRTAALQLKQVLFGPSLSRKMGRPRVQPPLLLTAPC